MPNGPHINPSANAAIWGAGMAIMGALGSRGSMGSGVCEGPAFDHPDEKCIWCSLYWTQ